VGDRRWTILKVSTFSYFDDKDENENEDEDETGAHYVFAFLTFLLSGFLGCGGFHDFFSIFYLFFFLSFFLSFFLYSTCGETFDFFMNCFLDVFYLFFFAAVYDEMIFDYDVFRSFYFMWLMLT